MTKSQIHLHVPAETKARWVRASRQRGQRLTDYITEAVEARLLADQDQPKEATDDTHSDPV